MFGKYNGFVSKARVSACMYFLVLVINGLLKNRCLRALKSYRFKIFLNNNNNNSRAGYAAAYNLSLTIKI
jgi:hypothetical protein